MLDCIIIGSGLAGISAALTLQAHRKEFLLFGSENLSEKIEKAEKIHNYPGLTDISGQAFADALKAQLAAAEITVKAEKVSGVYALSSGFTVLTQEGMQYECRSVILACGVESVKQIAGEEEFVGRGVSYCATCDGFLYKNKTIGVVCTTKRLEHEIGYLADFAKQVYVVPMYKNTELERENITLIRRMPSSIEGGKRVEKLVFPTEEIPVDGVFMLRESVSPAILAGGLQTQDGHVVVNRDMSTNIKGLYAAGDCTGRPYQYTKAAGEGNIAAHSVSEFLK